MDRSAANALIARLVGVSDGQIGRLWDLWSGSGGMGSVKRRSLLTEVREREDGERIMANVVTFGVLYGLDLLADVEPRRSLLDAFSQADHEELTSWADDVARIPGQASH